jgi:hypothetical protein
MRSLWLRHASFTIIWTFSIKQLVKNHPQRIKVRAPVGRTGFACELLRRHIRRRANAMVCFGRISPSRKSKITDDRVAVTVKEDVRRFKVAVN